MRVAVIAGDGIGKEVIPEALRVVRGLVPSWHFEALPYGADHTLKTGKTIDAEEMQALGRYDAIFLGALGDPRLPDNRHARDILLGMRTQLDLYVNFRPCFALADALVPLKGRDKTDVQFVVFRENTEGLYTGIGGSFKKGSNDELAIEQEINTRKGVERILRAAFSYAAKHGKKKLTMADKANAMSHGHGLWRRCFNEISAEFEGIDARALYVDNVVYQLVRDPAQFEVIVTNNLFGDIVTDLAAALQGGLGLAASANYHPGGAAMFEPVHGSAPDLAGQNKANPLGAILTAALMLEHLGETAAAARLGTAVERVLANGVRSADLGGTASTRQVGDAVMAALG